jgi:hypothetical protein
MGVSRKEKGRNRLSIAPFQFSGVGLAWAVLAFERRIVIVSDVVNPRADGCASGSAAWSQQERANEAAQNHSFGARLHSFYSVKKPTSQRNQPVIRNYIF